MASRNTGTGWDTSTESEAETPDQEQQELSSIPGKSVVRGGQEPLRRPGTAAPSVVSAAFGDRKRSEREQIHNPPRPDPHQNKSLQFGGDLDPAAFQRKERCATNAFFQRKKGCRSSSSSVSAPKKTEVAATGAQVSGSTSRLLPSRPRSSSPMSALFDVADQSPLLGHDSDLRASTSSPRPATTPPESQEGRGRDAPSSSSSSRRDRYDSQTLSESSVQPINESVQPINEALSSTTAEHSESSDASEQAIDPSLSRRTPPPRGSAPRPTRKRSASTKKRDEERESMRQERRWREQGERWREQGEMWHRNNGILSHLLDADSANIATLDEFRREGAVTRAIAIAAWNAARSQESKRRKRESLNRCGTLSPHRSSSFSPE